jgi:hypothetical protein
VTDERSPTLVFPFEVDYPLAHVGRLFGVQPERARLELTRDELSAIFGMWRVDTPLSNIEQMEVSGPYNLVKVIGPARLSLADGGLTFATNPSRGLCLVFREPVAGLLPLPWVRHGSLTVTVAEPERVKETLEKHLRALRQAPDEESAREAVEQAEQDAIQGSTTSELRKRAAAMGIPDTAEMSHAELVQAMDATESPDRS